MTDQDREQSESGDALERVLQIFKAVAENSADADYLYRGEPKNYCSVSSSLYRECGGIDAEHFDIGVLQDQILQEAKLLILQSYEDDDLLAHLQHFGHPTNLIDFTSDYLIALFFACDGEPKADGRVILLNEASYPLLKPMSPANRIIAQKSVFVRPPNGFVESTTYKTVVVPSDIKEPMLDYLNRYHGLSVATIYNDIHGFIRYHQVHESAYLAFYAGVSYQQKEKHGTAIDRFSTAIRQNPQLPAAYMNRGVAYASLGEYDLAIQDYEKAIELAPHASDLYTDRGDAYRLKGEFDLAIRDLDKAIGLNPNDDKAFDNRGLAYRGKNDLNRAIQDFDRAIEINPDNAAAHNNRGVAYKDQGKPDRAIQDFDRALELDPLYATAYSNRGVAYIDKVEYERAILDFSRALELAPLFKGAIFNRGIAYVKQGDLDRAIQDFDKAIVMDNGDAGAFIARGQTHWHKSNIQQAVQDYSKAIEIDPNLGIAFANRGVCWLVLKEWAKAEADLSTAKSLGVDVVSEFRDEFENVAAFEERYEVKLPASIVAMLTPNGDE